MAAEQSGELEAIKLYKEAGDLENAGRLGDAIKLYQKAYKLAPDIERILRERHSLMEEEQQSSNLNNTNNNNNAPPTPSLDKEAGIDESNSTPIIDLIAYFRSLDVKCEPKNQLLIQRQRHISSLPSEILIHHILGFLAVEDPNSIESFGLTCRLFYLLVRDMSLWKSAVEALRYCQPDIDNSIAIYSNSDYRQLFIETPRIRCDGIYICRCTYIRRGQTEQGYLQPIHLVTYYRYLRFFRDGRVWSVLSNNEPSLIIPTMRKSKLNSMEGKSTKHPKLNDGPSTSHSPSSSPQKDQQNQIMTGSWRLDHDRNVYISAQTIQRPQRHFNIHLILASSYRGGWNKLRWRSYTSTYRGEVLEYPLDNMKAYTFSRVKSFLVD